MNRLVHCDSACWFILSRSNSLKMFRTATMKVLFVFLLIKSLEYVHTQVRKIKARIICFLCLSDSYSKLKAKFMSKYFFTSTDFSFCSWKEMKIIEWQLSLLEEKRNYWKFYNHQRIHHNGNAELHNARRSQGRNIIFHRKCLMEAMYPKVDEKSRGFFQWAIFTII